MSMSLAYIGNEFDYQNARSDRDRAIATMAGFSDSSSELGSLSRSPTPPSSILGPPRSDCSTPLTSLQSSSASPAPDDCSSRASPSLDGADYHSEHRPPKRRRLSPIHSRDSPSMDRGQRKTGRLDLHRYTTKPIEEQTEADKEQTAELERLLKALHKKRKIVVIAGAGISVTAGIPDFRSSTGLFKSLRSQHNLKSSGKELFDASVYRDAPSTTSFHDMIRSLAFSTKAAAPTPFHHLLARLAKDNRLLRLYTQNVDGIDTSLPPLATQVPLPLKGPWNKTIQLHGGLDKMVCTKCNALSDFQPELFEGPLPPECNACMEMDHVRTAVAGKRSHGVGRLRPRMVLYNEHNPDSDAIGAVSKADLRTRPDAVLVVGTSLKIPGVRRLVREMCATVRDRRDGFTAWINTDPEPTGKEFADCWDLIVGGTSDEVAQHAGLRHYDDDTIDEMKKVTEEEMKTAQANGTPSAVVPRTPTKAKPADAQSDVPLVKKLNLVMGKKSESREDKKLSSAEAKKSTLVERKKLTLVKVKKTNLAEGKNANVIKSRKIDVGKSNKSKKADVGMSKKKARPGSTSVATLQFKVTKQQVRPATKK